MNSYVNQINPWKIKYINPNTHKIYTLMNLKPCTILTLFLNCIDYEP